MTEAITTIASGQLRGLRTHGGFAFKGVPYAASPAGPRRWLPPLPVQRWTGVREAIEFGPSCPQPRRRPTGWSHEMAESEDCLVLNVWTPSLASQANRPVMVWFHGGGYTIGSGSWPIYDGAALAARGDVVVVTVNHRLGPLGYLHLADLGGDDYASSGNVGMLDLIASLEWVRDNIAAFGGDAGNVTVFGESGGGAKVSVLHVMPAAEGLFHRAVVQSGPALRLQSEAEATSKAARFLELLGIDAGKGALTALQLVPIEALGRAQERLGAGELTNAFGPVLDGLTALAHPSAAFATGTAIDVPLLIGRNKDEGTLMLAGDPVLDDPESLDEQGLRSRLAMMGDRLDPVLAGYRAVYPEASLLDLLIAVRTDAFMGIGTARLAEQKVTGTSSPAYMYRFNWAAGRLGSAHGFEIPFVFDNAREPIMRPSSRRSLLAARMSEAWIAFARRGDPNHAGLDNWPPYTLDERELMVFDRDKCGAERDPFEAVHALWSEPSP
ncbi:MAG TPA: carboxylesterase/lipase family protein [Acidimicrobiales bacterium]|jgi:para-nitrobenzyl esterase|nr:carboxylesterase/lipase family protein [Acidimicrobiales bacterium]